MTPTEIKVLKIIWENGGKASTSKIANELKISPDYSHLICGGLIRNKIIEFSQGQYKLTDLGKKELEKCHTRAELGARLGMIEKVAKPKKLKKLKKKIATKKVVKKEVKAIPITKLSSIVLESELAEILEKKGFKTLEDIATTSISKLMQAIEGLELKQAAEMINEARDKLRKEGKEYLWE